MSSVSRPMFLVLAAISAAAVLAAGCGGDEPADPPTPQVAPRAADPVPASATASEPQSSIDSRARGHPAAATARSRAADSRSASRHAHRGYG